MPDLKTTNRLLLVIALCLVTLVGKELGLSLMSEARAAPAGMQSVMLYGCSLPYPNAEETQCSARRVQVDGLGRLVVKGP